jgi:hemoglobin
MYYTGRDMQTSHRGMKISESDWAVFLEHAGATLAKLQVPAQECEHVVGFVLSIKDERVDP